ncbi:uncharacterized protein [Panulirus ornatus]|uniref:uncharacterized protein n=1 Tax=Panulirus ornatus TaxID=150431 RepID=UPI003A85191B
MSKYDAQLAQLAKLDSHSLSKLDVNTLAQLVKLDPHLLTKLDSTALAQLTKLEAQQMQAAAAAAGLSKADLAELRKLEAEALSRLQPADLDASLLSPATAGLNTKSSASAHGMSKYQQLLAVIEEMGKDIRPTYAGSKSSAERLKRGIVHARILVRECLIETERAART